MSYSRPQAADVRRQRHPWHDTAPDHLAVRLTRSADEDGFGRLHGSRNEVLNLGLADTMRPW